MIYIKTLIIAILVILSILKYSIIDNKKKKVDKSDCDC